MKEHTRIVPEIKKNRGRELDANRKGLRFAVENGVVIHAAGKLAGGEPGPREWRKLFYSEGL
jgi:hypothetical protein